MEGCPLERSVCIPTEIWIHSIPFSQSGRVCALVVVVGSADPHTEAHLPVQPTATKPASRFWCGKLPLQATTTTTEIRYITIWAWERIFMRLQRRRRRHNTTCTSHTQHTSNNNSIIIINYVSFFSSWNFVQPRLLLWVSWWRYTYIALDLIMLHCVAPSVLWKIKSRGGKERTDGQTDDSTTAIPADYYYC